MASSYLFILFPLFLQGIVEGGYQQQQQSQQFTPQRLHLDQYLVQVNPSNGGGSSGGGQCQISPNAPVTRYHAPARSVLVPIVPAVDAALKREFLLLFHRDGNPDHTHFTPHDNITQPGQPGQGGTASPIDAALIAQINELCGRDTLFYSFSPRHMHAIQLLQQVFMNQTSAQDLLRISKQELSRHEINPRVWYYALLATFLMRPDLNGYLLAGPIDATPDLYVPWTIIRHAISQSTSRPLPTPQTDECTTAIGVLSRDVRFPEPPGQPGGQGQGQRQQNGGNRPAANNNNRNNVNNNNAFGFGTPNFAGQQQQAGRRPVASTNNHFGLSNANFVNFVSQILQRKKRQINFNSFPPFESQQQQRRPQQQRQPQGQPECIVFNGTNGAPGAENLLWYYREDVQVNEHHWFWHQYYPQSSQRHPDRRGEVFYFMHHNLVARYNAERLSNGLPIEHELDLRLNGNIGPGYFSDLNDRQSGLFWTPRLSDMPLSDIAHAMDPDFQLAISMDNITNVYSTLISHISQGILFANRSTQPGQPPVQFPVDIRNQEGLNHLGNTFEAAEELSLHANLYHNFGVHNLGHVAIALATDPDYRCRRPTGIMADASVTMRDPAFYRIHTLVDNVFDRSKFTLTPYQIEGGEWPLRWRGVTLRNVEVLQGRNPTNVLQTFWSIRRFPLEEGVDGSIHDGDINSLVCQQHLNHEPFQFRFVVDVDSCASSQSNRGTLRLFMAPRFDLNGRRFTMEESRRLLFQLDAFPIELRQGRNVITRNSGDSSSTRPWSRSLESMLRDPDNGGRTESCGCGWPQHLYIPKGTQNGMQFDLFAMVTNWDEDRVDDTPQDLRIPEPCQSPYLFCGVPYRRYPDRRPMNYPFDRQVYSVSDTAGILRQVETLEEFVSNVQNMQGNVITIRHLNSVLSTQ